MINSSTLKNELQKRTSLLCIPVLSGEYLRYEGQKQGLCCSGPQFSERGDCHDSKNKKQPDNIMLA